jgi:hypothetical protein
MDKENLLKIELEEISDTIEKLKSQTLAINREIYANKLKVPDRFLPRKHESCFQFITAERLNTEFKILEDRVNKLEKRVK